MSTITVLILLAGLVPLSRVAVPAQGEMCMPLEVDGDSLEGSVFQERLEGGRRQLEAGYPDRAVAELECAARLEPQHAATRQFLGGAYFQAGRWPEALDQYAESLRLDPENEMAHLGIAEVFLYAGLPDEADETLAGATAMFPASALPQYNEFYFRLAELYADAGRVGSARGAMEEAAARAGPVEPVIVYKRLGDFGTHLLDFDAAHEAYAHALAIASDDLPTRLALAALYLTQGRLDEALAEYEQVIRRRPDAAEARAGAAEVHSRAGRFSEAVMEARRAVALAPDAPDPHYVLGRALQFAGQEATGRLELEEYRRLQDSRLAEEHRDREIHAAQSNAIARFYRGDAESAIEGLRRAIARHPEVPDLRFSLGLVESQSGQHAAAVETYLALLEMNPEAADRIHLHLAREFGLTGDLEASERHRAMAEPGRAAASDTSPAQ